MATNPAPAPTTTTAPAPTTSTAPASTTTTAPAPTTSTAPASTATVTPATTTPPQQVEVTNWPAPAPGTSQVVTLPTGTTVRVDYTATFGDILVSVLLLLAVVVYLGNKLFDRLRGVL
jgi:hypothetical protein